MSRIVVRFPDFPDVPELSNDASGDGAWLVDVVNWWDGVDSVNERNERANGDGEYDQEDVYSAARFPVVVGRVSFASEAQLFAARAPFARMMASRKAHTIEVESFDGIQRAEVVRNGRLTWDMVNAPYVIEFELPFKAPDPRKYGPWQAQPTGLPVLGLGVESPLTSPLVQIGGGSPGRVSLVNLGSTDTFPEAIVSGGGMTGGVQITRIETAERLRLEWPILDTDTVRFSFADGQVWLNEQTPISGRLTVADWWVLGPGETSTVQFEAIGAVTGTPTLTMRWRKADS